MNKSLIITLIFLVLILTGCGKKTDEALVSTVKIDKSKLITIKKSMVEDFYTTPGEVNAVLSSNIAAKIMAKVVAVSVQEGDTVQKGQELALLDNSDIMAQLHSAESAYNEAVKQKSVAEETNKLAQISYQRYKNIYDEKALTRQELDEVLTKKNIAELNAKRSLDSVNRAGASLKEAQTMVSYSRIIAPISGIVTQKHINIGDTASPGQVLFVVKDLNNLEINANVDENYINKVAKGNPVKIILENLAMEVESNISEVIPSIEPLTRSFKVKINANKQHFKDGQYVKIAIPIGKKQAILIPKSAFIRKGQLEGVHAADGGFRLIKTGKESNGMIEVLSGLNDGDQILGAD